MGDRRSVELICLSLHSDASGRLDKGIDRPGWKPSERSATAARMRDRGIDMQQVKSALQVNLYDLPVQRRPGKMSGAALMEEQMKHHPIK